MAEARPVLSVRRPPKMDAGTYGGQTLREHVEERSKSLMGTRKDIDPIIAEISSLAQPARSRFMPTVGNRFRRSLVNKLYDGYGIRASGVLTNGMTSGLSSPSRPWFKSKIADPELMKYHAVKLWLSQVDQVMYDFMNATNFYGAAKSGYGELGLFGTEACFMAENWQKGMVCHGLTFGEYWLDVSENLEPDTLLRQVPMTVRQMVAKFVASEWDRRELDWSKVSTAVKVAWDNSNYNTVVDVMHLVEPNPAWHPVRMDAAGKRFRSIYWEAKCDRLREVLDASGQEEQPFWAARWDATGSDVWGTGPGWNGLADLRGLQAQAKRKGDATDMAIKPPMLSPASVKIKMTPGSVTHASNVDKDSVRPVWQADYRAIEVVGRDVKDIYRAIDGYFYVDLFMAISQMDGVQPRNNQEIFSREEEKLTQLGPVIERVNNEKLGVSLDRVFGICMRRGMFPPAPEELAGMEVQVDYISILAQAQRASGLSGVERSLGFVGNMGATFPGVTDNIDSDAVVLDYLHRSGFPMVGIRDPKARDKMRAARAQEMAAAQAKETLPSLKDAAEGAELLSRTDVRGAPLLDSVLGGLSG